MTVLAGLAPARRTFRYRDVLLEASYLTEDRLQSPDLVLRDYHLVPGFQSGRLLLDPSGHLAALRTVVCREYAEPRWVRRRCAHARERVLACTRSTEESAPLHDQAMACLFGAGITTHILLAAGLRNSTVRTRYVAERELLADQGRLEFHETLLELLGPPE